MKQSPVEAAPSASQACTGHVRQNISLNEAATHPSFPERVLSLQGMMGNRMLAHVLLSAGAQMKLKISQPGDRYEIEADRIADQVMRMATPSKLNISSISMVQRKCTACSAGGKCPKCDEEERTLHRKFHAVAPPTSSTSAMAEENSVPKRFLAGLGAGRPLDRSVREFLEPRFGYDFSRVRIHTDSSAADSARNVSALAFTVGRDIAFAQGQFNPHTHTGLRLLSHELTHVAQQSGAGKDINETHARQTVPVSVGIPSIARQKASKTKRPLDTDPAEAAALGKDGIARVGYDQIIRLALQAGFLRRRASSSGSGTVQRTPVSNCSLLQRQAEAVTFGAVFTRYAIAAGIASQVDSPAPGPGDVVAVGILIVGLVAAGIAVATATSTTSTTLRPSQPAAPQITPELAAAVVLLSGTVLMSQLHEIAQAALAVSESVEDAIKNNPGPSSRCQEQIQKFRDAKDRLIDALGNPKGYGTIGVIRALEIFREATNVLLTCLGFEAIF